ncbi:hypothetical protein [Plastoroseomonas arctica]|uniref:Transmembrane protein n=1 Tax=Plastoroseomonas arctica TaxID=1509237 RepID=A0AAF1KND5_9PROT|nr:hypothetical protein [Plastoroseomonas arctica]MBR0657446.1 hypothetical protein [Plastoroseomonas arctica]
MRSAFAARLLVSAPIAAGAMALRLTHQNNAAAAAGLALVAVALLPSRRLVVLVPVALGAAALALMLMRPGVAEWMLASLPFVGDTLLAAHFGLTLRPGREALIARYMRAELGAVPPECRRYAWRLTAMWAVLLAGLALVHLAALSGAWPGIGASAALHAVLIPLLFLAEHPFRARVFPALPASPLRTLRSMLRASHAG